MEFSEDDIISESDQVHIAGFIKESPVACAVMQSLNGHEAKMRQVAVKPELQGLGIGAQLILVFENIAKKLNFEKIVVHARYSVIGFYLHMGYSTIGKPFEEIGIEHQLMEKFL